MRRARKRRGTRETQISVNLKLDGKGTRRIETGLGFLDHMLDLLAKHSGISLTIKGKGDLEVDDHHLVEDVGLVLGDALNDALGKKEGIARYGWAVVPMDESLVMCALDLGGRAHLSYQLKASRRIKEFNTELIEEFFKAFVRNARVNLHLRQLAGRNTHHIVEAAFKALARALRQAVEKRGRGVPSTKGML